MANIPWEIPFQFRAVVTPLTTRGFAMWSNPAAFQTPSFLLDELNQKKLLSPKRSRYEWCPDQNQGRSTNLFMVIFGSPHQKSASKAPILSSFPSTGWCILVLSTCCQLGPSGRILAAAAAFPDWCRQCVFRPWLETY